MVLILVIGLICVRATGLIAMVTHIILFKSLLNLN